MKVKLSKTRDVFLTTAKTGFLFIRNQSLKSGPDREVQSRVRQDGESGKFPGSQLGERPPQVGWCRAQRNLETAQDTPAPHPASDGITFTDDPFSGHGRGQVNGIHENTFRFCLGDQGVPERRGDSGERTRAAAERQAFFSHEEPGSAFSPKWETLREKGNLTGQDTGCWAQWLSASSPERAPV